MRRRTLIPGLLAAAIGLYPGDTASLSAQQLPAEYKPDLRIGKQDGTGPDVFARVAGLEVDDAGRIFVLDALNYRVAVFNIDGTPVRAFGAKGPGPGEMERPMGISWYGPGELVVIDLTKYVVFDTTGRHLRTFRRTSVLLQSPYAGSAANGTVCDVSSNPNGPSFFIARGDSILSTLAIADSAPPSVEIAPGRRVGTPNAPRIFYQVDCARQAVWRFHSFDSLVYVLGFKGDTLRRIPHGFARREISADARSEAINMIAKSTGASVAALDKVTPRVGSYFVDAFIGRGGVLWIAPAPPPGTGRVYTVIAPDGSRSTARLAGFDPTVRPLATGAAVYGVVNGANDVDYVVRLRRQ